MNNNIRTIEKADRDFVKSIVSAYLDDDVSTILINGFDDNDKIIDVFIAVSKLKSDGKLNKGLIRTWTLGRASEIINRSLSFYGINSNILLKQNSEIEIAGVSYKSDKYIQNSWMKINEDVSIYCPVQGILSDGDKSLQSFRQSLENDKSKLKIIVTTSDYDLDTSPIDDLVDSYILLDSSSKYPDTYQIILKNMEIEKLKYE